MPSFPQLTVMAAVSAETQLSSHFLDALASLESTVVGQSVSQ